MAKLVLLNILLFLLVAAASSMAWPSYFDDAERDTLSAELEKETDRHAVANSYYRYDDAEVATYGDNADTADDDDDMATAAHNQHNIAEINWRRHRRHKNKNKKPKKGNICACKLEVYSEENYAGRLLTIREQNSNLEDMFNDGDDFIPMSFKVKGSCQWLIYSNYNFEGMSYILEPGNHPATHTWGVGGNSVYSARVLPPKGSKAIALFRWSDYTGRMVTIYNSKPDLSMYFGGYFNSFVITGGKWTLYTDTNYNGDSLTYSGKQRLRELEADTLFTEHGIESIKRK